MSNQYLIRANCFDIFPFIPNGYFDYVFTSPPYNRKRNDKYTHYNDTIGDYFDFLCVFTKEALRVTTKHVFINIQANYYNSVDVYKFFGAFADKIQNVFAWSKQNPMPASGNSITNSFEYVICLGDEPLKANSTYTKNHIHTSVARMTKEHRAVMHMDVADFFAENFFNEGDFVLDPFGGLATTAVACSKRGVSAMCLEIADEYHEMAKERLMAEGLCGLDVKDIFVSKLLQGESITVIGVGTFSRVGQYKYRFSDDEEELEATHSELLYPLLEAQMEWSPEIHQQVMAQFFMGEIVERRTREFWV